MHIEVLVEDQSGQITIDYFLEKILGENRFIHSWIIIPYKGVGNIPENLYRAPDPRRRLLLEMLPKALRGYGRRFDSMEIFQGVIVVVDLDNKDCIRFKRELLQILNTCNPRPKALFRIAIEETESWLLGDVEAVRAAYPQAKRSILDNYVPDSICGAWEVLADAVYPGGSAKLKKKGYPEIGRVKCEWAEEIAPHIDIDRNRSKSFQVFCEGVKRLVDEEGLAE